MAIKYVCAVGDSFVFGAELVTTYHWDEFKHLSDEQYSSIEFCVSGETTSRKRYNELLDSMRFSNLVAISLGVKHLNYAQGGASAEGIKFQSYLLMDHLKRNNIDPSETLWLVGLTMSHRKMMLPEIHETYHKIQEQRCGDESFVWSRYTCRTFYGDRANQSYGFTEGFTKAVIAETTETTINVSWVMNVLDIAHLLKANGVEQYQFLNLFLGDYPHRFHIDDTNSASYNLLTTLMGEIDSHVLPSRKVCFQHLMDPSPLCEHGHPTADGHQAIANYILNKINETNYLPT